MRIILLVIGLLVSSLIYAQPYQGIQTNSPLIWPNQMKRTVIPPTGWHYVLASDSISAGKGYWKLVPDLDSIPTGGGSSFVPRLYQTPTYGTIWLTRSGGQDNITIPDSSKANEGFLGLGTGGANTSELASNTAGSWNIIFQGDSKIKLTEGFNVGLSAYDTVNLKMAPSGVSAGTYGSSTQIPQTTYDIYGTATTVSNVTIASQTLAKYSTGGLRLSQYGAASLFIPLPDSAQNNEGLLSVHAGGSNDSELWSNTTGSPHIVFKGVSDITITESGDTIKFTGSAGGGGGVTGSGSANQVAFWSGASALTGDADLTFDGSKLTAVSTFTNATSSATPASGWTIGGTITNTNATSYSSGLLLNSDFNNNASGQVGSLITLRPTRSGSNTTSRVLSFDAYAASGGTGLGSFTMGRMTGQLGGVLQFGAIDANFGGIWGGLSSPDATNYMIAQNASGDTRINTELSRGIEFSVNGVQKVQITDDGRIGYENSPGAWFQFKYSAATAIPPAKFPTGALQGTVVAGGFEFGDDLYISNRYVNRLAIMGTINEANSNSDNTTTTETDLYTYTTKSNSFISTNGSQIGIRISGKAIFQIRDSSVTHRFRGYFAGTLIFDTGNLTVANTGDVVVDYVVRGGGSNVAGSGTANCFVEIRSHLFATYMNQQDVTGLSNTSATHIFKITGTVAGANATTGDLRRKFAYMDYSPAPSNP